MDEILGKINTAIENSSKLTRSLLEELKDGEIDLAAVKMDLANVKENLTVLNKLVRDGNGSISLITKIELINQKLAVIDKYLDAAEERAEKEGVARAQMAQELDELDRKVRSIDMILTRLVAADADRQRKELEGMRKSIADSEEINEAEKRKNIELKREKGVVLWKILGIVLTALIGGALAWLGLT